jgi:adenylate cyclase
MLKCAMETGPVFSGRPFHKTTCVEMKARNSVLQILFLLFSIPAFAQKDATKDSLLHQSRIHANDTNGVKAFIGLAENSYLENPAEAESYCRKANELAGKIHFADGEITACGWLAFLLEQRGSIDSALLYNERALALARSQGFRKSEGTILNNIAAIYKDRGRTREALSYYEQCIALKKEVADYAGLATTYNNIGLIYYNQGQIDLALEYYNKSLHVEDSLGRKGGIAISLHNIAGIYKDQGQYKEALEYGKRSLALHEEENDKYTMAYGMIFIGSIYEAEGQTALALQEYEKSLTVRESLNDKQGMAYSWRYIGAANEKLGNIDKARDCYSRSIALFAEVDDKSGMASVLTRLGNLELLSGNVARAKSLGLRSLEISQSLGYPVDIRDAAGLLNKVYRSEKSWENALEMNDLFIRMRDSILNEETRRSAMRDKFTYEFQKKESVLKAEQAAVVNRQKLLRNAFITGFILVLLLAGVLLNRYKLKLNANRELEKKNTLISQEKDRAERLLLNILPSDVAAELQDTGTAKAKDYESVTVMFTDFLDFTRVGEALSPQQLVSEIDYYFRAFDRIISKYRVEKVKTIGDAYMCASGIPGVYPDHAEEMVKAALEIRDFISRAKTERTAKGEPFFDIRIGINTGPLVAGVVGSTKFSYDIWGDSVNLASRMESNSESGKINISASTYELVKQHFNCSYRGKIEAKNKGQVDMYFVEAGLN